MDITPVIGTGKVMHIKKEYTPGCGFTQDKNREVNRDVTMVLGGHCQSQYPHWKRNSDISQYFRGPSGYRRNTYNMVAYDIPIDVDQKSTKSIDEFFGFSTRMSAEKEDFFRSPQSMCDEFLSSSTQVEPVEEPNGAFGRDRVETARFDEGSMQTDKDRFALEETLDYREAEQWMTDISGIFAAPDFEMNDAGPNEIAEQIVSEDSCGESDIVGKGERSVIGAREVNLLVEALQTRSFTPILYLLSTVLGTNSDIERLLGGKPNPHTMQNDWGSGAYADMSSNFSTLDHKVPFLSQQGSVDSDRSPTWPDSHTRHSLSDSSTDNEDLFTDTRQKFASAVTTEMKTFGSLNSTPNNMTENGHGMGLISTIDDMMQFETKCDLRTFKELLDQDPIAGNKQVAAKSRSRVWKTIGTGTNSIPAPSETLQKGQNESEDNSKSDAKPSNHRPGPNKCYHLWDFLRELLDSEESPGTDVVAWTDKEKREFKLKDTKQLAELWGKKKKLSNMNYDKLSRSLRYYIKLDILRKVPGKRLYFRFGTGRMWRKMKK